MRGAKRFWKLAAGLASLAAIGILALPLWFPWMAAPLLRRAGVRYASYRRDGADGFVLADVRWSGGNAALRAARARGLLPTAWLWDKLTGGSNDFLTVSQWKCVIAPGSTNSVYQSASELLRELALGRRWAPRIHLVNGDVQTHGQSIGVPDAQWRDGALRATVTNAHLPQPATLAVQLNSPSQAAVQIQSGPVQASLTAALGGGSAACKGDLIWNTNHITLSATFGRTDNLPLRAAAEAKAFSFPADLLRLKGYQTVEGSGVARWETNHFTIDAHATAAPEALMPPAVVDLAAEGDTNHIQIKTMQIRAQGLSADLSPGLDLTYTGRMLNPAAVFRIDADAGRLLQKAASGRVTGVISLHREAQTFPDLYFNLASTNLAAFGIQTTALGLDGRLLWPNLGVTRCHAEFPEGASVDVTGEANLPERKVNRGALQISGIPTRRFLPPELDLRDLKLKAAFSGPFEDLKQSGSVQLFGVRLPRLAPLKIDARWSAHGLQFDDINATASAGDSALTAEAAAGMARGSIHLALEKLDLHSPEQDLSLAAPADGWARRRNGAWAFALSPVRWRGTNASFGFAAAAEWPENGSFNLTATNLSPSLARDFLAVDAPDVTLQRAQAAVTWSNGPAVFSCDLQAGGTVAGRPVRLDLSAGGDAHGIDLRRFSVAASGHPLVEGAGELPTVFYPAREGRFVEVNPSAPLHVELHNILNPGFWSNLTRHQPVMLTRPSFRVDVDGSIDDPRGSIEFSAQSVRLSVNTNIEPVLASNVQAGVELSPNFVTVSSLRAEFLGQLFSGGGQWPVPHPWPANWRDAVDWRKGTVWLHGTNLQLAAFAQFAPHLLAPQGVVNIDLNSTNGQLSGHLSIRQAQTQPLPDTGAINNMEADVDLAGSRITLTRARGTLGGGAVVLRGWTDLARHDRLTRWPIFNLQARAQNVPLARTASLILRTGFDVKVSNETGGPPLISGFVNLGRSYFLSDPTVLAGHLATPSERPPFFSIDKAPFADFRLNVQVDGTKFLTVQSPFFNGMVSAGLHLGGTLREPVALGNVKIDSGEIDFPFADLKVTQGSIFLTLADPYEPQLYITAAARAYSYDIHLQVTGPASHPNLEFSSTPGLPSEQILLMLTTGEMPVNGTSLSTEQRVSRVGMFVGKNTLSQLGIFPGGEERLTFGNGEAFGELTLPEEVLETYSAEYKLSANWWLIGEYDPFGVSLGVKWRFYAR